MIELVIVVVAFSAAGLVLYNGIFANGNNSALQSSSASTSTQQDILPYGNTLNFDDAIKPKQFNYNQMQYPQVVKSEIGIQTSNLVIPLPVATSSPSSR